MFEVTKEMREIAQVIATDMLTVIEKHENAPSTFIALMSLLIGGSLAGGLDKDSFIRDVSMIWDNMVEMREDANLQAQ